MNLEDITPLVLTWNEAPNLRRCLERLRWASRIVIIDSGSTDETRAIAAEFPQVDLVERTFDSFAAQCNFGLEIIQSEWVLSLDADYMIPWDFPDIATALKGNADGYRLSFRYCVGEHPLRATLYPPRTALYRRGRAKYRNDGHGHKVEVHGEVQDASIRIDHDDRKPLSRWLDSQRRYATLEADKLLATRRPTCWPDRLRKMIWPAAPAAFIYTLFVKRLLFDGWPGLFYVLQRTYAEIVLSLELLDRKMRQKHD